MLHVVRKLWRADIQSIISAPDAQVNAITCINWLFPKPNGCELGKAGEKVLGTLIDIVPALV
jgi:hypothetical protein